MIIQIKASPRFTSPRFASPRFTSPPFTGPVQSSTYSMSPGEVLRDISNCQGNRNRR